MMFKILSLLGPSELIFEFLMGVMKKADLRVSERFCSWISKTKLCLIDSVTVYSLHEQVHYCFDCCY